MTPRNNCITNRPTHCSDVTWLCAVVMEILQLASVTVFGIRPRFVVLTSQVESGSCACGFRIVYTCLHGIAEDRNLKRCG